jgi:hypothetical protein
MDFKEFFDLQETHYTDVFPKTFEEFRKKYIKTKNDNTLFVQFTNHASTDVEKSPYKNPDHNDPIGVYAYPLKYVIDHPADIRYGRNSKYLRVIRNILPSTTLELQNMEYWYAKSLLVSCGLASDKSEAESLLEKAQKIFKFPNNSARIPKQFFANIQFDLNGDSSTQRSGQAQTNILLKTRSTSVLDLAKNRNTAVINSAEPNQIIFLSRNGFEIEEVFKLKDEVNLGLMTSNDGKIIIAQKLAAQLFKNLNDSIVSQTEKKNSTKTLGPFIFFSKNGKKLEIKYDILIPEKWSFNSPTKFKDAKFATRYYPTLTINGEKGEISERYDVGDKIEYIADDFAKKYNMQELNPNFSKNTLQKYLDEKQRVENERKQEYFKQEEQKRKKQEIEFRLHSLNPALSKAGMKQIEETDNIPYYDFFAYLTRELNGILNRLNITNVNEEALEKLWETASKVLPILFRRVGQNITPQTMEYIKKMFNNFAIGSSPYMNAYTMLRDFTEKN